MSTHIQRKHAISALCVAGVLVAALSVAAPVAPASAGSSGGKALCKTIDATASSCTLPAGPSTTSGTFDAAGGTGTLTATLINGTGVSAWPTSGSVAKYVHFQVPTGQTVTAATIDESSTTCTIVTTTTKKSATKTTVAVSANGVNVNNVACADGQTIALDTTLADVSLTDDVLGGVVLQYKTADPRSTKTSLWRSRGDYTSGAACETDPLASNEGTFSLAFTIGQENNPFVADQAFTGSPAGNYYTVSPLIDGQLAFIAVPEIQGAFQNNCYTIGLFYGAPTSRTATSWPTTGGALTDGGNYASTLPFGPMLLVPEGGSASNEQCDYFELTWVGTGPQTSYKFWTACTPVSPGS